MLKQLNILTGIQFTSPTGIIGQYNHGMSTFQIADVTLSLQVFSLKVNGLFTLLVSDTVSDSD